MEAIIDASSESAAVGLATGGRLTWNSGALASQQQTRQLVSQIVRGLAEVSAGFGDLDVIVVALGPGPFNGLRVAAATAKGLAAGMGAKLVGVPTMLAEAYRCPPSPGAVRIVLRAGHAGFSTALFTWQDGSWHQAEKEHYVTVDSLPTLSDGTVPLRGDSGIEAGDPLAGGGDVQPSRLATLARLGWQDYAAGRTVSAAALQPIYVRPPHITTPRDRRR